MEESISVSVYGNLLQQPLKRIRNHSLTLKVTTVEVMADQEVDVAISGYSSLPMN